MFNDSKSCYSHASLEFLDSKLIDEQALKAHNNSKSREEKYNENWNQYPVNLNDLVEKFAPNSTPTREGINKYTFFGTEYDVVCDMSAGYCRIRIHGTNKYATLEGSEGNKTNTHFKIKKREEM